MIQVAIIPSNAKGDSLFSYLAPLLEELKWMQDNLTHMTGIDQRRYFTPIFNFEIFQKLSLPA